MNKRLILPLIIFIASTMQAIEVINQSDLIALITQITIITYDGLNKMPIIKKLHLPVQAGQITQVANELEHSIAQLQISFNNRTYQFTVTPNEKGPTITITPDKNIRGSAGIVLQSQDTLLEPTDRSNRGGLRLI